MNPKVSVIVTLYNYKEYIPECINSFLIQDFPDSEMVIVDDGSTDDPVPTLLPYLNKRVRLFQIPHSNYACAKNVGIQKARADILVMLDADDMLTQDGISTRYTKIQEGYDLVHGPSIRLERGGARRIDPMWDKWVETRSPKWIHAQGVMLRKWIHREIGLYDSWFWAKADREMFYRIAQAKYKIGSVDRPVSFYRIHSRQMHRSKKKQQDKDTLSRRMTKVLERRRKGSFKGLQILETAMKPEPLSQMFQYKESDIAVVLGSGQSINRISKAEWKAIIHKTDTWAMNNWVYHPTVVPKFYHVEAKWYNYNLLRERLEEKRSQYHNTKFLFEKGKGIRHPQQGSKWLHMVADGFPYKFEYPMKKRDPKRTHPVYSADYTMDGVYLTKSYDMSMTCLLELLYKFGYKWVVLYGVDLTNSYYFWSGHEAKYGQVHHQTNKAHEGKDPKLPHNTALISDFIVDFHERRFKPSNREILVGHTKTALWPRLDCSTVRELL